MKSEKSVLFCELFSLGLFFSVLFLSFFRNLLSSLGGIELFIPLFGIPVFFLIVFTAGVILIPRNLKFNLDYHTISNFTALLFAAYGLVFLFLSFRMLQRFLLRIFFVPDFFRSSVSVLAIFLFACGYTAGIITGIMLKKLKTPEEHEAGINGLAGGIVLGSTLLLMFLFFLPQWMVFLPSASGFFFLSICFLMEEGKLFYRILFFCASLIFCLSSVLFIFFNGKEFFAFSLEFPSGKYELSRSGIRFNGRYEAIHPEMDQMLLLTAALQKPEGVRKALILSPVNMSFIYAADRMKYVEETEILTPSSKLTDLLLRDSPVKFKKLEEDPVFFLKNNRNLYDLIVLSVPDCDTLSLRRFFTLKMFRAIQEHLDQNGIFAMRLSEERDEKADRILASIVSKVFSRVLVTGGKNRFLLASEKELTLSPEILGERMNHFFAEKDLHVPQKLFFVAGPFLEKDSFVIDGTKTDPKNGMTKENPLLLSEKWKNIPILKNSGFVTETYSFIIRHLSVILLIPCILYLILRYFMTDRMEKKMFFRSIELGGFIFGMFSFFCILFQMRIGTLYVMIAVFSGMFALGMLIGRKIRESRFGILLSGLLPFVVFWIQPDRMQLAESVFIAGMLLLGIFFRSSLDFCREKCEDVRWTPYLPAAVMLGGTAGFLLICCAMPCYGALWSMVFLLLIRLPGMLRHS